MEHLVFHHLDRQVALSVGLPVKMHLQRHLAKPELLPVPR